MMNRLNLDFTLFTCFRIHDQMILVQGITRYNHFSLKNTFLIDRNSRKDSLHYHNGDFRITTKENKPLQFSKTQNRQQKTNDKKNMTEFTGNYFCKSNSFTH